MYIQINSLKEESLLNQTDCSDLTNPTHPNVLWKFYDSIMARSYYIYIYFFFTDLSITFIIKIVLFEWIYIQIYHVWEGYLRKISVERRNISRAEWRE